MKDSSFLHRIPIEAGGLGPPPAFAFLSFLVRASKSIFFLKKAWTCRRRAQQQPKNIVPNMYR